jgi:hypothetical protein
MRILSHDVAEADSLHGVARVVEVVEGGLADLNAESLRLRTFRIRQHSQDIVTFISLIDRHSLAVRNKDFFQDSALLRDTTDEIFHHTTNSDEIQMNITQTVYMIKFTGAAEKCHKIA